MNDRSQVLGLTTTFVKVAYIFAAIASVIMLLGAATAVVFPGFATSGTNGFSISDAGLRVDLTAGVTPGSWRNTAIVSFSLGTVSSLALFYIFGQLKQLLETVAGGRPFTTDGAVRIKRIGLVVVVSAFAETVVAYAMGTYCSRIISIPGIEVSPVFHIPFETILLGLVIICLADVFRHGAKLQEEHDLTV